MKYVFVDIITGETFAIPRGIKYISNAADSIVSIGNENTCISKPHCEIIYGGKGTPPMVQDCGSEHGTFINGRSVIGRAPIRNEDILSLGDDDYYHPKKGAVYLKVVLIGDD